MPKLNTPLHATFPLQLLKPESSRAEYVTGSELDLSNNVLGQNDLFLVPSDLTAVVPFAANDPVDSDDKNDDAVDGGDIVHV